MVRAAVHHHHDHRLVCVSLRFGIGTNEPFSFLSSRYLEFLLSTFCLSHGTKGRGKKKLISHPIAHHVSSFMLFGIRPRRPRILHYIKNILWIQKIYLMYVHLLYFTMD